MCRKTPRSYVIRQVEFEVGALAASCGNTGTVGRIVFGCKFLTWFTFPGSRFRFPAWTYPCLWAPLPNTHHNGRKRTVIIKIRSRLSYWLKNFRMQWLLVFLIWYQHWFPSEIASFLRITSARKRDLYSYLLYETSRALAMSLMQALNSPGNVFLTWKTILLLL